MEEHLLNSVRMSILLIFRKTKESILERSSEVDGNNKSQSEASTYLASLDGGKYNRVSSNNDHNHRQGWRQFMQKGGLQLLEAFMSDDFTFQGVAPPPYLFNT